MIIVLKTLGIIVCVLAAIILTAAELSEEIGGLILQYPALMIPDAARKGEMLWIRL